MRRTRILIADDHQVVIEGLRILLESHFKLVEVVGENRALLRAVKKHDPDVILLDLSKTTMKNFKAIAALKKIRSRAKMIILTIDTDVAYVIRAFELGVSGFVSKITASSELVVAIRQVLKDRIYVSPSIGLDSSQLSLLSKKGGSD